MNNDSTADRNGRMIDEDATVKHTVPKMKPSLDGVSFVSTISENYATKDSISEGFDNINKKLDSLIMMKLHEDGSYIRFIEKPTEEMKMVAVEVDGLNLQYIKDQMFSHCLAACEQDGMALEFVNPGMQTYKNCEAAIKSSRGRAIEFVNPDSPWYDDMAYEAVKYNGANLEFVKNPSERVIIEGVKRCPCAINTHLDAVLKSSELMGRLIAENPCVIKYIHLNRIDRNEAIHLYKLAIQMNVTLIIYIQKEVFNDELCLAFLEEYGTRTDLMYPSLRYIPEENRTLNVCLKAVSFDVNNIEYVPHEIKTSEIIEYFIKNSTKDQWNYFKYDISTWCRKHKELRRMYILKCLGFYRKKKTK